MSRARPNPTRWYRRHPDLAVAVVVLPILAAILGFMVQQGIEPGWVSTSFKTVGLESLLQRVQQEELVSSVPHDLQIKHLRGALKQEIRRTYLDLGYRGRPEIIVFNDPKSSLLSDWKPRTWEYTSALSRNGRPMHCHVRGCSRSDCLRLEEEFSVYQQVATEAFELGKTAKTQGRSVPRQWSGPLWDSLYQCPETCTEHF